MDIVIIGEHLPGRTFCDAQGGALDNVHVGVQVGSQPSGVVRGDAPRARWDLVVRVDVADDGALDFKGDAVHGRRGERFLYLTWGNVTSAGSFEMFRRAKLMLNRIGAELIHTANRGNQSLIGVVDLTDDAGGPRCARVDPPAVAWSIAAR